MDRRAFVTGLGAVLAAPRGGEAQQAQKVSRIGFMSMRSGPADNPQLERSSRDRLCGSERVETPTWPLSWFV